MHQMSPGVERAVAGARDWARRLGKGTVRLSHHILALLDEEEGRPAMLLERAGISVADVRESLQSLVDDPDSPDDSTLFTRARNWSISHRQDPEFMTDAFLIAVLKTNPTFQHQATSLGLDAIRLEKLLTNRTDHSNALEPGRPEVEFSLTDISGEMSAARVIDANLNRGREATRVLEDYCRFVLDDRLLTEQIKELRHDLAQVAREIPQQLLLSARETLQDVGTSVTVAGEYERRTALDVAIVNLKRLQESLRSLEEFGKLSNSTLGQRLESLRYRAYTLERAIATGSWAREKLAGAKLYVLLTGSECRNALDWTIERAAAGGAQIIQLREKTLNEREWLERAWAVRRWTRKAGVLFIVNDRPDIARLADADGVHLGQDDLSVKDARRIVGPDALIGVSAHSVVQVKQAVLDGADYIGIGPTFPSKTKSFPEFPGLELVRQTSMETSLPTFAIGGIGPANIGEVVAAGGRRVAVSSAIADVDDPEQASRMLCEALD